MAIAVSSQLGLGWDVSAQNYQLRYVTTDSGAITFVGNTLGLSKITQQNAPGQLDSIGGFITLNTNSQLSTYPKGTTLNWSNDSSSAVLVLPTNSTVLYAELIWAGTAQITTNAATVPTGNVLAYLNNSVQFVMPNGASNNIAPDPITATIVTNGTVTAPSCSFYCRSANVTALVQAAGPGTYSCGGVPACALATEDANNAAGWTLAVVYENTALHQRNLSLFIGNSFASTTATTPAPIGVVGFCSPPTGAVNGYLFVSAIEGDPNKFGDEMLFGATTNSLAVLSGPNNISTNFFAGQINYANPDSSSNGLLNTTGTFGLSNSVPPNVGFSARQGWDITCVNVSSGLANGIGSAYAQNVTSGDGYSVDALALQIDVGSPVLTTTQSVDKASTFVGDTLTYTVVVTNSGTADAVNLIFNDPLPFGTSFIANTFATNGVIIPGADPVTGVPVPIIKQGSSITFMYQVTVDQIPPSAEFITHATINYQYSGPCAESPIINSSLVNAYVQTLVPLLNVSKASSLSNVIPNATFTYTINIPNQGTTNTIDATLLDPLPVGVSYVPNTTTLNGTSVPDLNGGIMPYEVATEVNGPGEPAGEINAGQAAVVTFQVQISANPPTRINNSATIYANGIQPTTAANFQNNITPVYGDLAAGISASPNPVLAGGPVSFTISVTNNGPSSLNILTNFVTLYLPIPSSVESPIYTPGTGAYNPLTGVWSGITLASNGVVTHRNSLLPGERGSPSPAAAMMSRWISFVPPPNVRISAARCDRSMRPASNAPGDPARTGAPAPSTSISSRYASTANSVPNTFVTEASAGPHHASGSDPPVEKFQELHLGVHPGQVQPHPLGVDHPFPAGQLGRRRPVPHLGQRRRHRCRRGQRHPFVVELVGDQRPAPVFLAHQRRNRHPDRGVVGGQRRHPRHRVHRRPGEALGRGRHDDDRQPLVPDGLGIGPAGEPERSRRTGSGWSTSSAR